MHLKNLPRLQFDEKPCKALPTKKVRSLNKRDQDCAPATTRPGNFYLCRSWYHVPLAGGPHVSSAMSNPRGACGPVEDFVRLSLGLRCSKSILHIFNSVYWQLVFIFIILNLTFWMQVVLSASLSRLLPLRLGFERLSTLAWKLPFVC